MSQRRVPGRALAPLLKERRAGGGQFGQVSMAGRCGVSVESLDKRDAMIVIGMNGERFTGRLPGIAGLPATVGAAVVEQGSIDHVGCRGGIGCRGETDRSRQVASTCPKWSRRCEATDHGIAWAHRSITSRVGSGTGLCGEAQLGGDVTSARDVV